jgi:hypothetical protein
VRNGWSAGIGLSSEDVKSGAIKLPFAERVDQRRLINQRAARGIDQYRTLLHQAYFARPDDSNGFPGQWKVQRNDIRSH